MRTRHPINPRASLYLLASGVLLIATGILGLVFNEMLSDRVDIVLPFLVGIGVVEIVAGALLLVRIKTDADARRRIEREGAL